MAYEAPELEGFLGTLSDNPNQGDRDAASEIVMDARDEAGELESGTLNWADINDQDMQDELDKHTASRRRRDYGLEGDEAYAFAQRLYGIGEGNIKTAGQISAEKELDILSKAQRGKAMGYGGFNSAELLQKAGRSAQQAELGGESAINKSAEQAQQAAKDQLEQLLISGEQRAENKAFALQQLAFQQEQASGSLWSNVLGGVLGAIGAVVGSFAGPGGAIAGATAGKAMGSGAGRYMS